MYQQNALAPIDNFFLMQKQEREVTTSRLTDESVGEVLQFLSERPIHTVAMAGFIRANGIVSEHHRGVFYGCRNAEGQLEGVALIGHSILIESRTDRAIEEFAKVAQATRNGHLIMGEQDRIKTFLKYYADGGQELRRACREILFELRCPVEVREEIRGLRLGTLEDLELLVPVHAQMSFEESGVNPLEKDPVGFRQRCARRLERNQTYVWVEDGKLLFKADIISETAEATYVEGVWISPEKSGQGYALRCVSQITRDLLSRSQSVCLLTNVENEKAQRLYHRAGFKVQGIYDSIFLKSVPTASTH